MDVRFYMKPTKVDEQFCAVIKSVKIWPGMVVHARHQCSLLSKQKTKHTTNIPIVDL